MVPRFSISREGWSYLFMIAFVLGGAVLRERNLLVMLAGLMIGPFLLNWRLVSLAVRSLRVERRHPHRVCAGELISVELVAHNTRRWFGIWGTTVQDTVRRDDLQSTETPAEVCVLLPSIAAGSSGSVSYRCLLTRRGQYQFGPLHVITRYPLGLVAARRVIGNTSNVTVCPRVGRLTSRWMEAVESERSGDRISRPRRGIMDGDYYGVREWRAGDSPRWVHWRSTAKRGDVMVREFEQQRNRDIAVLVDLWRPAKPREEHLGMVELALSFTATVAAKVCHRGGRRLTLAVAGHQVNLWQMNSSPAAAEELLEQLAFVRSSDQPQLVGGVEQMIRHLNRNSRLILVTTHALEVSDIPK
jgi:uncharacterized protein (DUF58 family)